MNMKMLAVIGSCATVLVLPAHGNEPYFPKRERAFQRLDANHDGKVERTEFATVVDRRFNRMDTNADKSITGAELAEAMQKAIERRRARIMALLDRDKDGTVTEAEFDAIVDSMFAGADADGDGGLTLAEMQNFKRADWRRRLTGGDAVQAQ